MTPAPLIKHLYSVERWTLLIAALFCATGLVALSSPSELSITVGSGLAAANAWAMRSLGTRILRSTKASFLILLLNAKLLVIGALLYLAFHYLPIVLLPFTMGISALPLAVLIVALRANTTAPATEESHG